MLHCDISQRAYIRKLAGLHRISTLPFCKFEAARSIGGDVLQGLDRVDEDGFRAGLESKDELLNLLEQLHVVLHFLLEVHRQPVLNAAAGVQQHLCSDLVLVLFCRELLPSAHHGLRRVRLVEEEGSRLARLSVQEEAQALVVQAG